MNRMQRKPMAVVLSSDAVGLGAVRSLHLGQVPTTVVMMDPWEPVRASRYGHKILVPQSADRDGAILEVLSRIEDDPPPILIPTSDHLAYFVSRHRRTLETRFRCCIPSDAAINTVGRQAKDTAQLTGSRFPSRARCRRCHPPRRTHAGAGPAADVKPRTFIDKENLGWRNVIITSLADAEVFYRENPTRFGNVIAQELIPGPDTDLWESICLFDQNSEVIRAFTFRKLSTMPAHYGATARGRSERNETLVNIAEAIGKRLNYVGIADLDFKYDRRDRQYKYLELNPRLGLCHHFGTRCGVNLTHDAYRQSCGERLTKNGAQEEGRTFLAVLEEIGARLHSGDSLLRILRTVLVALLVAPVGPYFADDDIWPGPFAVARVGYRLVAKASQGQLASVFTKQYQ
jgi:predicted ATP-grasp superfamily ATP-dependent carboligase